MTRMTRISRPRKMVCTGCGTPLFLGDCGVKAHRQQKRTLRDPFICNGYVYIHEENGFVECPNL